MKNDYIIRFPLPRISGGLALESMCAIKLTALGTIVFAPDCPLTSSTGAFRGMKIEVRGNKTSDNAARLQDINLVKRHSRNADTLEGCTIVGSFYSLLTTAF